MTWLAADLAANVPADLQVDTHREDATVVVTVRGELDIATAPLLRAVLDSVWARKPERVEVDLSGTTFLDSHALGALVAARRRLSSERAVLILRQPSRVARRVLELSGLGRVFELADSAGGGPDGGPQ